MTTGQDLIESVMRKTGALGQSETPSAAEATDVLEIINDLLDSWANDGLSVYARTLESYSLSASDGEYTYGSGGNINTTRPVKVIAAYIRSGTTDYPLEIISDENYALIQDKSATGIPTQINFDNGFATNTVKLYPVPASAYTLYILSEKPLSALTLSGTVSLPPGWKRAIIYNAAIDAAPEFGQPVTGETVEIARESLGAIRTAVAKARSMDRPAGQATGNIYTGYY
jgi:hypothetical protein